MIARRRQVALVLTAVLAAAAACQNHERQGAGHPAPPASAARGSALAASGDVLPHSPVIDRAALDAHGDGYDSRPVLFGAEPVVLRAGLALCHAETVHGAGGGHCVHPAAEPPPQMEGLAATGCDGCSTVCDHAPDDGAAGVRSTPDAMDGAGPRHPGTARDAEARSVTLLRAGPAEVAHPSDTPGTNGVPLPPASPGPSA
ncbi:CapA family protein [Streptomyces sp. NPDC052301]|uniref:CapA family protein n=1 Tax=Streptomyces sp. NPDC052301 TaxID=3365687 RepID=UPI0037D41FF0